MFSELHVFRVCVYLAGVWYPEYWVHWVTGVYRGCIGSTTVLWQGSGRSHTLNG